MSNFDLPSNRIESSSSRAIDNAQLYNQTIGLPSQSESQFGRYAGNESASNQLVRNGLLPELSVSNDAANLRQQGAASICANDGPNLRQGEIVGDDRAPFPDFDGIDEGVDDGRDVPDGAISSFDRTDNSRVHQDASSAQQSAEQITRQFLDGANRGNNISIGFNNQRDTMDGLAAEQQERIKSDFRDLGISFDEGGRLSDVKLNRSNGWFGDKSQDLYDTPQDALDKAMSTRGKILNFFGVKDEYALQGREKRAE